ncbi:MAG TPA: hypothetical protein VMY37_11795 [Thermoguttaceae bacterium]|nr:hypothetical protein [Thermoguttaceae bacterium]HUU95390.1 hypothetical protein [Phycisphaerae bacterium]HUW32967.1 hypothetical protein [Planctomycetota bacterium]
MTIPPVTPGEPIDFSADVENAQRDFINMLMKATGYDNGGFGSTGFSFLSGFAAPHAIFEIQWTCNAGTCYVVWDPDDAAAPVPPGLETVPDVPYTLKAKRIWVNHSGNTYGQPSVSPDTVIYFPLALDEDDVGGYSHKDRIPAWYDEQSGRWWSLNNPATLSSSSSGVETSSSSGSSSSGVEESSSSGVEESSSSGVCDTPHTGTIQVLTDATRIDDNIIFAAFYLDFVDGVLCDTRAAPNIGIDVCCPETSSSGI